MSTDPTQDYLAQVREALADLPSRQRDELLEDLPGHLAETVAESDSPLETLLGSPQAYAAELRSAAGLASAPPPRVRRWTTAADDRIAATVASASRRFADGARELPYGRQVAGFLPELRPGWWVLRGYLVVAVPAAFGALGFGVGVPPFVTLFGSDLLGLVLTVAAIVASVRLGRRDGDLPEQRRHLVVAGNVALVLLCVFAGIGLRQQIGYNTQQVVYASEASYLQGPDGGISNIYAFDADGRPLTDVQLFDQDGRPIDTLLLQAPDGAYAEPVRALDEYGTEVANVFPRTLMAEVWDEGGYRVEPVPRPAIAPRRLATPSPSSSPSPSPSVGLEPTQPFLSPDPSAPPSPEAPSPPAPVVPPGPVVVEPTAPAVSPPASPPAPPAS